MDENFLLMNGAAEMALSIFLTLVASAIATLAGVLLWRSTKKKPVLLPAIQLVSLSFSDAEGRIRSIEQREAPYDLLKAFAGAVRYPDAVSVCFTFR